MVNGLRSRLWYRMINAKMGIREISFENSVAAYCEEPLHRL